MSLWKPSMFHLLDLSIEVLNLSSSSSLCIEAINVPSCRCLYWSCRSFIFQMSLLKLLIFHLLALSEDEQLPALSSDAINLPSYRCLFLDAVNLSCSITFCRRCKCFIYFCWSCQSSIFRCLSIEAINLSPSICPNSSCRCLIFQVSLYWSCWSFLFQVSLYWNCQCFILQMSLCSSH